MCKYFVVLYWLVVGVGAYADGPVPDVGLSDQGLQVVINVPQTRLFLYQHGQLLKSYPVAVGKILSKTPSGSFAVTGIYPDPSWNVPRSIQDEMRAAGKPVRTVVPPGQANPLGKMFIRFGEPGLGLGIHGTNAPASVPGFRSHGCVRMKNPDVIDLSTRVALGATVTVINQSILLNQDDKGHLWLTVFHNQYQHNDVSMPLLAEVLLNWQRNNGVAVYGRRVDLALFEQSGKPSCLTCVSSTVYDGQPLTPLRWLSAPPDSSAPVLTGQNSSAPLAMPPNSSAPNVNAPGNPNNGAGQCVPSATAPAPG